MKTFRILTLKLAKRLRHRKDKYISYLYHPRPARFLPDVQTAGENPTPGRGAPLFFFHKGEREHIAREAQDRSPNACRATIAKADRFCLGECEIFGDRAELSGKIKWHTDYATGRTWPKIPAPRLNLVYPTDTSDIKAPWELARFQFLNDLGRARAYTGDKKYVHKARETIESFLDDNPYGIGIHWCNPMEAAIRSASWIVADGFFDGAAGWDEDFRRRLKLSLYDHGRFIHSHLERDGRGINNNHYTANLAGLFILGLYLRDVKGCDEWLDFALAELDVEIDSQIAADGVHYENSPGYHRLTFEMFFYTHCLGLLNSIKKCSRWAPILARMAGFTLAVTMPDGRVPNFGDNDDGLWLSGSPRPADDHRYIALLSAAAFGRPDPTLIEPPVEEVPEDVFWYLGREAASSLAGQLDTNVAASSKPIVSITESQQTSGRVSEVFGSSGLIVMRSTDAYVLVSANPVGTGGIGGHKHNDILSYIFTFSKHRIVIDPGTYAYTAEPALRNALRGTAAHNTVMVDNAEQNRFFHRQLFGLYEDATPEISSWKSNEERDWLTIRHDGYRRLPGEVVHTRSLVFNKVRNILAVFDQIRGTGIHDVQSTINLGPGVINADDPQRTMLTFDDGACRAGFHIDAGLPWQFEIEPAWRSTLYRQKTPGYRLIQRCRARLPICWTTIIGVFDRQPVDWQLLRNAGLPFRKEPEVMAPENIQTVQPIGSSVTA